MSRKPAIVIAPGAWHPSSMYSGFETELQAAGYPTFCDTNPSIFDAKDSSCAKDTEYLRDRIVRLLDWGLDVVLVAHSYGGTYGCAAVAGLSKDARAEEQKENGVIGIILVGSIACPAGQSMRGAYAAAIDQNDVPAVRGEVDQPSLGFMGFPDASALFYGCSAQRTSALEQMLLPQGTNCLVSPAPAAAWREKGFQHRLGWILPTKDMAIRPSTQRNNMISSGVEWKVREVDGSHGVMLDKPREIAALTISLCEEFLAIKS